MAAIGGRRSTGSCRLTRTEADVQCHFHPKPKGNRQGRLQGQGSSVRSKINVIYPVRIKLRKIKIEITIHKKALIFTLVKIAALHKYYESASQAMQTKNCYWHFRLSREKLEEAELVMLILPVLNVFWNQLHDLVFFKKPGLEVDAPTKRLPFF